MNKAHLFKHLKGDTDIEKLEYLRSIGHPKNGPIYTQVKYNGIHCRLEITPTLATFYTKPSDKYPDGKPWRPGFFEGIFADLLLQLSANFTGTSTVNYYGELLMPRARLQDIAAEVAVNRLKLGDNAKKSLYLVIYDRFDTGDLIVNQPFSKRYAKLAQEITLDANRRWRIAQTESLNSNTWANERYNEAITNGHEGVMYRVDPCFMVDDTPTWHFIKRKQRYDMEGTVLLVHEGKGKHLNHLGSLEVILPSGAIVKVGRGEGWTEERLAKLWTERVSLIGKTITFSYEEMSKAGIPLRNQLVAIQLFDR